MQPNGIGQALELSYASRQFDINSTQGRRSTLHTYWTHRAWMLNAAHLAHQ